MMMTPRQIQMLASFIATLRDDWDQAGIAAALRRAAAERTDATATELAHAAIRAATTPSNRTPAVIALAGPHWEAANRESREAYYGPMLAFCRTCGWHHRDDEDHYRRQLAKEIPF